MNTQNEHCRHRYAHDLDQVNKKIVHGDFCMICGEPRTSRPLSVIGTVFQPPPPPSQSEHKMSAEEQARNVFNRIFKNVSPWTEKEGLAELTAIIRENEEGRREALRLAQAMHKRHYSQIAPHWKPLDDIAGLVSQIDNMHAGVATERDAFRDAYREKADALECAAKRTLKYLRQPDDCEAEYIERLLETAINAARSK